MPNQLHFQDATSYTMKALIEFHDQAMSVLIFISVYVGCIIYSLINFNSYSSNVPYEGHELESIWTLMPSLVLIFLALPSLHLLYILEETSDPSLTVKVMGYQWFWSYEYPSPDALFDCFMLCEHEINTGEFRLLETDNHMFLPYGVQARILITAADVLHSWTIPSLGVKADAVPGRLNQIMMTPQQPGVYYGQCSEICGANHSFMPITLAVINYEDFLLLMEDWRTNGPPWSYNPHLDQYVQYRSDGPHTVFL